jgi:uncharacterized membrane protein YedE/YeeE
MPQFPGFTPLSALAGGVVIGLSATLLYLRGGHIAGISSIVAGLIPPLRRGWEWRALFVGGLLTGGLLLAWLAPAQLGVSPRSNGALVAAGLLVGFGTRLGGGCTSGHGICGLSRLSRRSLVAVLVFMATAVATVTLLRLTGVQP